MSGIVRIAATLVVVLALLIAPRPDSRTADAAKGSAGRLENAAPSPDALIERFLEALRQKDRAMLHGLRVTEAEYVNLIMAGSVEPGQPLRQWPEKANRYFWSGFDEKSRYYELYLLGEYGGHAYRIKSMEFDKGTKTYATYEAYRQLRLVLEDETGKEAYLATGSIADVGGQWKFISFIRD
jgi:hypothetical protein